MNTYSFREIVTFALPVLVAAASLMAPAAHAEDSATLAPPPATGSDPFPATGDPRVSVELELVLLVDTSTSVDSSEFALQRDGYVAAFRDAEVQDAILAQGGVAVRYVMWSGSTQQTSLGWFQILSRNDCLRMADKIADAPRPSGYAGTVVASAVRESLWSLSHNAYESSRQVIDVSGDGVCNNYDHYASSTEYRSDLGVPWADVMAQRPETTKINGISIGGSTSLKAWYGNILPQGAESFAMNATDFTAFAEGIKLKLIREIVADEEPVSYD